MLLHDANLFVSSFTDFVTCRFLCFDNLLLLQPNFFPFGCSAVIVDNENSSVHIDAVVDPLSPVGQKVASLLRVLKKYIQPSMRIVLNPMVS